MTLQEAYRIANGIVDHANPTEEQREAKWTIYKLVLNPHGKIVSPILEPDFLEGWK